MDIHYPIFSEPPELWGGLECTINRIYDKYRDQLKYSGHDDRESDIPQFAKLGIKKIRYPLLWEAHQKNSEDDLIDWASSDKKIGQILKNNMEPIVGLVHHGSGPSFTALDDNNFPYKLASFAGKVAEQFPYLKYYTPVNEPLTTARFSGLYGLWYPHKKEDHHFCRMFVNQLKGIVLSMHAVRKTNPDAVLVQTEDLTKVQSSPLLKYQAKFENRRRWLTYDFLCGTFHKKHPLWNYFIANGIEENELYFFMDNPCTPGIAGFNYYVTSERYLDENIQKWPECVPGSNGKHTYVDVPTVRAIRPVGVEKLLTEVWNRFHIPIALTEVHLNCSREEQLRWFMEAWKTSTKLNNKGISIQAVTAWSLLGAFDWDSLLTRENLSYEAGVFKICENKIRPTALATVLQSVSKTNDFVHPLMEQKGWWHYSYPNAPKKMLTKKFRPLLILGGNGTLGTAFRHICDRRNIHYHSLARPQFDITKTDHILRAIEFYKPWAVINATGYVKVDEAETERDICYLLNVKSVAALAEICSRKGIQMMTFSSDLVFDGGKTSPYTENDFVSPLNFYGQTKAESEHLVKENFPDALIIRTSSFFGPWDQYNFAHQLLKSLREERAFQVVNDITVSPTYVPHMVDIVLDIFIDKEKGIWHICNTGNISWSDFGYELAKRHKLNCKKLVSCSQSEMNWRALRPDFSALQSEKGIKLPSLQNAIDCFFKEKVI